MAEQTSGIDVSHYQGAVDWNQVAQSGVAFAIVKATEGLGSDAVFAVNWQGMSAAGLVRGAYHFFRPSVDALAQAKHYCDVVGALGATDLPPALDLEPAGPKAAQPGGDEWNQVPAANRVALVQTWLDYVQGQLGKTPMIYTYASFWQTQLQGSDAFADYPLWIASTRPTPSLPLAWAAWTFWQWTDKGACPGVQGQVDQDWFQGSAADLSAFVAGAANAA